MTTVQINNNPVELYITETGAAWVHASSLLRAVGYKRPSDAIIHYEQQEGEKLPVIRNLDSGGHAKYFPVAKAIGFLSACRYRRRMGAVIETLKQAVEESRGTTTEHPKAPRVRRPESKLAQNDRAAGVAWLTGLLEDTNLPYALHLQALKARAELLDIQAQLAGGDNA